MKKLNLKSILILLLLFGFSDINAQNGKVPQPEFTNMPAFYIEGTTNLKNFSKEIVTMAGKMGGANFELQGPTSSARIKASDPYLIIIKAGDSDPSIGLSLYKLTATKKKRQAQLARVSLSGKVDMSRDQITYKIEKLEDKIYKIVPDKNLEKGEYGFMYGTAIYTFGIE